MWTENNTRGKNVEKKKIYIYISKLVKKCHLEIIIHQVVSLLYTDSSVLMMDHLLPVHSLKTEMESRQTTGRVVTGQMRDKRNGFDHRKTNCLFS